MEALAIFWGYLQKTTAKPQICHAFATATRVNQGVEPWVLQQPLASQVSVADFECFMRVAHRNAPDYGIYGLLELLANLWQNSFLMICPLEGESENRRVYIGDLNGGPGWT